MSNQAWSEPTRPNRMVALLAAAGVLCVIAPVLAVVSFFVVGFSMDSFLDREDACVTYACGEGTGGMLFLFSLGWMCVMWIVGLATAALAVRTKISVGRAIGAAVIAALVVTVIAIAVDWAWVVWSV